MDKIIQIFIQLGADESIFYQFALFIILFVLLRIVFFDKVLFVLQARENQTTKMEEGANNKFGEAEKISKKFEEEISVTRTEEIEKANVKKQELLKKLSAKKENKEKEIQATYEKGKKQIDATFVLRKDVVMESVSILSDDLVQKLTE